MGNWSFSICIVMIIIGRMVAIPHEDGVSVIFFGIMWTALIEILAGSWRLEKRRDSDTRPKDGDRLGSTRE